MVMFVAVFVLGVFIVIIVGIGLVAEQRAFQFLVLHHATGGFRQVEQGQWLLELRAGGGDFGFVCVAGGDVLETHQVHRRAFQFQLQGLAVQRRIQASHAMFVGTQAAMLVIVFVGGMGDSQRQHGKRQSEKQTTHDESPKSKMKKMLCNLITQVRRV
ncbi:hypothetical protein D3C86_1576420 [compost metagenome]